MDQKIVINQVVLLNLSDHYTRTQIQKMPNSKMVIGALIGKQIDRNLFLQGSFEALFKQKSEVDIDFMHQKTKMYRENSYFKETELLGWYSVTQEQQPSK